MLTLIRPESCEFGRFQGEGVEFFFNRTSLTPLRFLIYLKICFESDSFIAFPNEWDWREKNDVYSTNQPLITSFYIKKVPIFAKLAISQRSSAIFCATGVWGLTIERFYHFYLIVKMGLNQWNFHPVEREVLSVKHQL